MMIKPSAAIRNNYRKVADYCIETGQPVYLTNNGEGELVVMSIQAWEEERQRIRVEETLSKIESERKNNIVRYTPVKEVFAELDRIIDEAGAITL
ncbi:MAG: type II toxin-antitoxin system Phd/YefM family antitoxin [Peptococcaceae bacterium]|jgi:PHD/YefM family antitoxin component YafN of YafNO toxin-antitoxin module|nr:type II toxin-antitoxin system Phd/YefM family antitoxin [Peptococcaceae bacterium]